MSFTPQFCRSNAFPLRRFSKLSPVYFIILFFSLFVSSPSVRLLEAQNQKPPEEGIPTGASCGAEMKLYDSPFFKVCYPKRWHVIRGYNTNYAWWVFSKRKRGERFDRPYIRVIIGKGIAQTHLALQNDSRVLGEREYVKATNIFKDVRGTKLNKRYWREIAVGPEFDILAWYELIKGKQLPLFDRALDSFWVPPPPREAPKKEEVIGARCEVSGARVDEFVVSGLWLPASGFFNLTSNL